VPSWVNLLAPQEVGRSKWGYTLENQHDNGQNNHFKLHLLLLKMVNFSACHVSNHWRVGILPMGMFMAGSFMVGTMAMQAWVEIVLHLSFSRSLLFFFLSGCLLMKNAKLTDSPITQKTSPLKHVLEN